MFNIKGCFFSASFFYSLIFVRFLSYNKTIMLLPYLNGDTKKPVVMRLVGAVWPVLSMLLLLFFHKTLGMNC